jgi:kynurenine 3-monooxygenase
LRNERVTIAGAGLVGSLVSIFLAKRGFAVDLVEKRPDMRRVDAAALARSGAAGRSINLAVSTRGLHALEQVGLREEILKQAIPMRGRMIHPVRGDLALLPYGKDESEYINSISRAELNKTLMSLAERTGKVRIQFETPVAESHLDSPVLIGTDGAASAVRAELMKRSGNKATEAHLDYGYKELSIAPGPGGSFRLFKNALHIWPRGNYMLIALPNLDGSFTCTLFLPFKGAMSFEALDRPAKVEAFFQEQFPDAVPLLDDLTGTFFSNPTGHMVTVKCEPWHDAGRTLLMGDAAHAIVPFFGQGMNCGFEDCTVLGDCLDRAKDWKSVFADFSRQRKPNADAIADMAVENFIEMRDKVADPRFQLEKAVEKILEAKYPDEYVSRYRLVTFSRVPYRVALEAGVVENAILAELCEGLKKPEDVDHERALRLIRERLAPVLRERAARD